MKKIYIISLFIFFLNLFSFSFWYIDAKTGWWEDAVPLSNSIGFYSLADCGLDDIQIADAIKVTSPLESVEGAPSLYYIKEIASLEEPHSDGFLIRKEITPDEVPDTPVKYGMIVDFAQKLIIFNSYYTPSIYGLMHECGHIAGLGHSNITTAIMYENLYYPNENLDIDDKYGLYSHYCKPSIIKPSDNQNFLKGINKNIPISFNSIDKMKPSEYYINLYDTPPSHSNPYPLRSKLNADKIKVSNQNQQDFYIEEWNSTMLNSGIQAFSIYLDGSQDLYPVGTGDYYNHDQAMDINEVLLYDLAFSTPEENGLYSALEPQMKFKVVGKVGEEVIPLTEIKNVCYVTYMLETAVDFTPVFDYPLWAFAWDENEFEYIEDLNWYNIAPGDYVVTATALDENENPIAKVERMPIKFESYPNIERFEYKDTDKKSYTNIREITASYGWWVDYSWYDGLVNDIRFYYKFPDDVISKSDYSLINAPVSIENDGYKTYHIDFDPGIGHDLVSIKVEVTSEKDGQSFITSKEQTFELVDRYLKFIEPKPVGEGFVDFESILYYSWGDFSEDINFIPKARILAEEDFDINRFWWSSINQTFIDPLGQEVSSLQNPVAYKLPDGIYNWLKFYSEATGFPYIYKGETKNNELPATCMAVPLNLDSIETKTLIEYEDEPWFGREIIRSKPGKYTQKIRCFDWYYGTTIELTHGEEQDILIPDWKLKTWGGDFRFWPPLQKKDFGRINDNIEFCIWRPAVSGEEPPVKSKLNSTNINVYKDDTMTSVFSTSTVCEPEVTKQIEWVTNGMTPGFFRVEGSEVDLGTGMNVKYDSEIQICPFYEHWENEGFFFNNWSSTIDSDHWGIHEWTTHYTISTKETLRKYSLEAKYDTGAEIKYTELQTISIPTEFYSEYDLELDFEIGIPATTYDNYGRVTYDQLLANYKVLVSKDGGGNWTVMKLANTDGYMTRPPYGIIFKPFFFKLGKTGGQPVLVKLVKEGIQEFYTDETEDPKYQSVFFDEIIVKYSKGPLLTAPNNIAASGGGLLTKNIAVNLEWEQAVNSDPAYQVQYYNIWRNGKIINYVNAPYTKFTDTDIQPDGRYNYAIEAVYNVPITNSSQAIYKLTSLLDCNIWVNMSDFPAPENLALTNGTGVEYNNVKLTWEVPVGEPENITGYKIYRNNEYVNTTKKTTYTDYFLEAGEYTYKVSALYANPTWESFPCEPKIIGVVSNFFLPLLTDFENSGIIPTEWNQQTTTDLDWIFINEHPAGLTFPYETGYFAYFGSETAIPANTTAAKVYGRLMSPIYNFSSYESVSLIYDYLFKSYRDNSIEFNVYIKNIVTNDSLLLSSHTVADMTEWNAVPWIVIPENYLSSDCHIMFEVALNKSVADDTVIGSVSLDNIELQGNIGLDPPQNVRITNNQGFVSLAWDPVVNAVAYHIYRSEYPDKNFTEIAIVKPLNYGSRLLPTSYSDIIKKPGNSPNTGTTSVKPAVDYFKRPYYYRVAAEINENLRTLKK